jgi:polar amino acid transport system substrate-binding protein
MMLTFEDGSIGNIVYVANGDKSVSKEHFEVFCEGGVARLDYFSSLELSRNGKSRRMAATRNKGHKEELELTLQAMRGGMASPIPLSELFEVTEAAITVADAVHSNQACTFGKPKFAQTVA